MLGLIPPAVALTGDTLSVWKPDSIRASSIVGRYPGDIETFSNELCIETVSFAASLLMHINKWYARPHLIH